MEEKRIPGESLELENDNDEDIFFQWSEEVANVKQPKGSEADIG